MPGGLRDGDWIAVQVRVGREQATADGLHLRDYCAFLPCSQPTTVRGDARGRRVPRVLFPGYVFCRYRSAPRHRIVEIPDVIRLVGPPHAPIPIAEEEIEAIRRIVNVGVRTLPWKFIQAGQQVYIQHGPLSGLRGVLLAARKPARLVVSLSLVRRSVAAEIDVADTTLIDPALVL